MKNVAYIICIVLLVFFAYKWGGTNKPYNPTPQVDTTLLHKLDSLVWITDSIRLVSDSLQLQIDSSKTKVVTIYKEYEKGYADITNASIADDIKFFADYLSEND